MNSAGSRVPATERHAVLRVFPNGKRCPGTGRGRGHRKAMTPRPGVGSREPTSREQVVLGASRWGWRREMETSPRGKGPPLPRCWGPAHVRSPQVQWETHPRGQRPAGLRSPVGPGPGRPELQLIGQPALAGRRPPFAQGHGHADWPLLGSQRWFRSSAVSSRLSGPLPVASVWASLSVLRSAWGPWRPQASSS